jgi:hypothetical protein
METVRDSARRSKARWILAALALGVGASALMACVDEEGTPGTSSSQQEVSTQCEWGGCPPLEPCGDWRCGPGEEVSCPEDCGIVCGDGVCSPGEQCSFDCGAPTWCGDGVCNGGETSGSCPADCGTPSWCGDGICNGNETWWGCPADCPPPGAWCGNGTCDANEDIGSCPGDCQPGVCGNCICEGGERQGCPTDCGIYVPGQPLCPQ